ncbi:uncharacterized protein LOC141668891 isoform X6 [Apium graveolens]|uniref:uncharacterized protein LOC141668891 isoform X6 n=1 Tax=Apium graveolens TaxID=4045 RepID=UPI003D7BE289
MTICGISNTSIEHIIISWSILLSNRSRWKSSIGATGYLNLSLPWENLPGSLIKSMRLMSLLPTTLAQFCREVFERSSNHPGTPNQSFGVVKICYLYSLSSSLRFLIHVGLQRMKTVG